MVEIHSVDQPDQHQEKELVLSATLLHPGEMRKIELAGTRVVYSYVDGEQVRVFDIILGDGTLFVSSHPDEEVVTPEDVALVVGQLTDSDAESGRSAIMICDGHHTYTLPTPQPGHTIRVRSHFVAPKKGELLFG